MYLKSIELAGFKSFGKKTELIFTSPIASIVGPNGSGKSNVAEGFRFVLGEQSMKSMRSKKGEDLIWGGSPGLPRGNRASVKVVFDNSSRLLDLDFKEVTVERVVYRDGQNEYLLNGSQVRLKDVIRLLAGANIGGSGYQIISQGEADRILNASPKERREMVEDALGLKLYQHKKAESERKLEETASNIDKTRSLRREIAPHLNFLRVQVEKIEKAREMKDDLAAKLGDYLARENAWITQEDARLLDEAREHDTEVKRLSAQLAEVRLLTDKSGESAHTARAHELHEKLQTSESRLVELRRQSSEISRDLGRAEGALEANTVTVEQIVTVPHVRQFAHEIDRLLSDAEGSDHDTVRALLNNIRGKIKSFIDGLTGNAPVTNHEAQLQVDTLAKELSKKQEEETAVSKEIEQMRAEIARIREASFAAERDVIELEGKVRDAQNQLNSVSAARASINMLRTRFEEEIREGIALIGAQIQGWEKSDIPQGALSEDRREQEKRHRDIERLKIKIEESGLGNGDAVIKEFNQTKERDEFLTKELADLESSAEKLHDIIAELEKTIDIRFKEGLKHINVALKNFFAKLFNGGEASLQIEEPKRKVRGEDMDEDMEDVVPEEEELYAGLSISVSLPRKKVKGLEILSGGERALTSIALIFSMSQVNPPPFLILDETDAALDEANSRRYADMIKELGQKSQLIVITHNRATMAAAGELYGVTMSNDGVSKLLSVKFEEATKVAK
jgi:chromosome segregation ATPase